MATVPTRPLRRDAARNREKLLREAAQVFTEQGLNGSLEEVARRAGVSIGTLYNHFPHRDALIEALLPERLAALGALAAAADAEPDPWRALTGFCAGMVAHMTADRGLLEALVREHPAASGIAEACRDGAARLTAVLARAAAAGVLRSDVADSDVAHLIWAMSLLGEAAGAEAGQRCLALALDGLRA